MIKPNKEEFMKKVELAFPNEKIAFTKKELKKRIKEAKPNSALLFNEATGTIANFIPAIVIGAIGLLVAGMGGNKMFGNNRKETLKGVVDMVFDAYEKEAEELKEKNKKLQEELDKTKEELVEAKRWLDIHENKLTKKQKRKLVKR